MSILISAAELDAALPNVRVLDIRWTLGAPDGRADYLAGHIPLYAGSWSQWANHPDRPVATGSARA